MMKHLVTTPEEALTYITDCNLATIQNMCRKKSKSKHEFLRQISIAQTAINWIIEFKIDVEKGSRIYEIINYENKKVENWVENWLKLY